MGSTFVVKKKSSGKGWRLLQYVWKDGVRHEVTVPTEGYFALKFNPTWTLEEARNRAKQMNAERAVDDRKAANAARRVHVEQPLVESAFLPKALVEDFTTRLKTDCCGTEAHERRLLSRWRIVQQMIAELRVQPADYADQRRLFYRYCIERNWSLYYTNALLKILNLWGAFVSRKQRVFFEKVPPPRGVERERVAESNEASANYRAGGSSPLSVAGLGKLAGRLSEDQYRWVYCSYWFGLRPSEVNGEFKVERQGSETTLWVYQPKLVTLPKPKRWKAIPILYPEQVQALEWMESRALIPPLVKTMQKYLDDERAGLYSGRKGFTDLMLGLGQKLEDVSVWMGHTTIERTWRNYKNRKSVGVESR